MPLTYGALCALAAKHNVTITENMRAFVRAVEEEDLRAQAPLGPVSLAAEHAGMRVDYSGLLNQARNGLRQAPALAEMLRQLQDHLAELGRRWYAGDAAAMDEFLQLYCIEPGKRAIAATKQPHADDAAVDRFAAAMKAKLAQAREKGRGGWQQCDPVELSLMLREHVEKGDPRDVANFCMFLWCLGKPISADVLPFGKRAAHQASALATHTTPTMREIDAAWSAFNGEHQNDTWRMGAAIAAARAVQGREDGLGAALLEACRTLPSGYSIEVYVENGFGGIELCTPGGETTDFADGHDSLTEQVRAAILAAARTQHDEVKQ